MQVTIDRQKWQRGEGDGEFYNEFTGNCCAMGFICLAAGIPLEDIIGLSAIDPKIAELVGNDIVGIQGKVVDLNDDSYLEDDEREEKLGNVAREAGIELTFIN